MAVTIREVAKAAGVSESTVSIVVNNKSIERSIPKATQEKIFRAMRELDYKPNLSARRLRGNYKQDPVIVFFWPLDFRISILASFLNAFSGEIQNSNFACELVVRTYNSGNLRAYDNIIMKSNYSGVIIGACTEEDIKHLESINPSMPVILINRDTEKFSSVSTNNELVGRIVAEEFCRKGYKSAAVFASNKDYLASNLRVEAFIKYCKNNGIYINEKFILRNESTFEGGYNISEIFCGMNDRPKAIFCDSDSIALGALKGLKDKNIRVPYDAEILTIDITRSGATFYSMPALSVIEMPNQEIGKAVIRVLIEKISNNYNDSTHVKINPKLILRDSFS